MGYTRWHVLLKEVLRLCMGGCVVCRPLMKTQSNMSHLSLPLIVAQAATERNEAKHWVVR